MRRIQPETFQLALDSRSKSTAWLARQSGIPISRLRRYADPLAQGARWAGYEIDDEELDVIAEWLKYPSGFFEKVIERYPVYFCEHGWTIEK